MRKRGKRKSGNGGGKFLMLLMLGAAVGGGAYLFKMLKPDLIREMRMMKM